MRGKGTDDIGMIETLEHPHFAPHALLLPFDFPLRNRLQCDLACDVPRCRLGGGLPRGREEERVRRERVGGGGGGRVDGPAARRSAGVHCSGGYVPCRALQYAMTLMWGL